MRGVQAGLRVLFSVSRRLSGDREDCGEERVQEDPMIHVDMLTVSVLSFLRSRMFVGDLSMSLHKETTPFLELYCILLYGRTMLFNENWAYFQIIE